jgi:hypothetical protein
MLVPWFAPNILRARRWFFHSRSPLLVMIAGVIGELFGHVSNRFGIKNSTTRNTDIFVCHSLGPCSGRDSSTTGYNVSISYGAALKAGPYAKY